MAKVNDERVLSAEELEEYRELFLDNKNHCISDLQFELSVVARSKDYEMKKDEPNKERLKFLENQTTRLNRVLRFVERVKFRG